MVSTAGLERIKEVGAVLGLLVTGLGTSLTGLFPGVIVGCWKLECGL